MASCERMTEWRNGLFVQRENDDGACRQAKDYWLEEPRRMDVGGHNSTIHTDSCVNLMRGTSTSVLLLISFKVQILLKKWIPSGLLSTKGGNRDPSWSTLVEGDRGSGSERGGARMLECYCWWNWNLWWKRRGNVSLNIFPYEYCECKGVGSLWSAGAAWLLSGPLLSDGFYFLIPEKAANCYSTNEP